MTALHGPGANLELPTLSQFYGLMRRTRDTRARMVLDYMQSGSVQPPDLELLRAAMAALQGLPRRSGKTLLLLEGEDVIATDLRYETLELEKDIFYFSHGEENFLCHLEGLHAGFAGEVSEIMNGLGEGSFRNFLSDRDGTVNDYCSRYASSIQSAYNAIFLTRFAKTHAKNPVLLTSAPLEFGGIRDVATVPDGTFIFAGSKGREYFSLNGERGESAIPLQQRSVLERLKERLNGMLLEQKNSRFALIGSGFQQKFGQITVARQDINRSITSSDSDRWLERIRETVAEIDPRGEDLRIEDTCLDVEIMLTVTDERGQSLREFDKGDGLRFLDRELGLGIAQGRNLVCGDTTADLPMVQACGPDTISIFVTTDPAFRRKLKEAAPQILFASHPDVLVTALNSLASSGR